MTAKRIPLYREGFDSLDGRFIQSSTWPQGLIPLLIQQSRNPGAAPDVIGTVTDLRRDTRTGWVSGIARTPANIKGFAAQANFDNVVTDDESARIAGKERGDVIATARLRAITLGNEPNWSGMWI
jgi:hypothetical protein